MYNVYTRCHVDEMAMYLDHNATALSSLDALFT